MINSLKRSFAFGIDLFICFVITAIYIVITLFIIENFDKEIVNSNIAKVFFYITIFLSYLYYYSSFESSKYQATYGKNIYKILVSDYENNIISLKKSLIKNFAKSLIAMIIFFFNPVIYFLSNYSLDSFYSYMAIILFVLLGFQILKINESISKTKSYYLKINNSIAKNIFSILVPAFYILMILIFIPSLKGAKYNLEVQELKINAMNLQTFIESEFKDKSLPDKINDFKAITTSNKIINPFNNGKSTLDNISLYDDYIKSKDKAYFKGNILYKKTGNKYNIYSVNRDGDILSDSHGYFYLSNE